MSQVINISTVTPVYSGQDYLEELVDELANTRKEWSSKGYPFNLVESIFVNDSAIDNSEKVLARMSKRYSWIKVVTLSKNYGQHPATVAGILHSSGDWIITLDEDLQHKPMFFVPMIELATTTSSDIIYANPETTVHQSFIRDNSTKFFKRLMALITRNKNIPHFNSYRLIRGSLARATASVCSHETYFDIALSWFTVRIKPIVLPMKDKRYIETKVSGYDFLKLIGHSRRMMLSSQMKLLHVAVFGGAIAFMVSVIMAVYALLYRLLFPVSEVIQGWASLFLSVLFFGGVLSFMLGIIIEYLAGISLQSQGKPIFFTIDRSMDASIAKFFMEKKS